MDLNSNQQFGETPLDVKPDLCNNCGVVITTTTGQNGDLCNACCVTSQTQGVNKDDVTFGMDTDDVTSFGDVTIKTEYLTDDANTSDVNEDVNISNNHTDYVINLNDVKTEESNSAELMPLFVVLPPDGSFQKHQIEQENERFSQETELNHQIEHKIKMENEEIYGQETTMVFKKEDLKSESSQSTQDQTQSSTNENYESNQGKGSNWDLFSNQYLFQKKSPISNIGKS